MAGGHKVGEKLSETEFGIVAATVRRMKVDYDSLAMMPHALVHELAHEVRISAQKGAEALAKKIEKLDMLEACALLHMARKHKPKKKKK